MFHFLYIYFYVKFCTEMRWNLTECDFYTGMWFNHGSVTFPLFWSPKHDSCDLCKFTEKIFCYMEGGGGYLFSLESSLKMWENGIYVVLISWTHQLLYKFQILKFIYFCQILGVNSKILLYFPLITWKNVGRVLFQLL